MLEVARGPLLVGVADRPSALAACAELDPAARLIDLVEARLDLFAGQSVADCADACRRLEATGTPVLATLRTAGQGGRFAGSESERLARFREAAAVASWADVERGAPIADDVAALLAERAGGTLVVSHHDFEGTPPLDALLAIVDGCHAYARGQAIAKVATAVKTDADRAVLLELVARRPHRTCVIGMDAAEDPRAQQPALRFQLAARGSLLAYGYLVAPTAPGQLSASQTHARLLDASPAYLARRRGSGDRPFGPP
jgi:3-dehydroquinate dehydratase-1